MTQEIAWFRRADRPGAARLVAAGEIDVTVSEEFGREVSRLVVDAGPPAEVEVDLTGVTHFESSGVEVLVTSNRMARDLSVPLVIEPSPIVRRVLEAARVADDLELRRTA